MRLFTKASLILYSEKEYWLFAEYNCILLEDRPIILLDNKMHLNIKYSIFLSNEVRNRDGGGINDVSVDYNHLAF